MKVRDMAELALRNLREAALRNSLTTLGVAVGVASLVAMLSLGVGLQQFTSQRLSRSGLFNAVFVAPRTNLRGFGGPERPLPPPAQPPRPLDEAARLQIERLPNVTEAYPQINFITAVQYAGNSYAAPVAGLPATARSDDAFANMQGAFFSGPAAGEAILQIEFAKELSRQPATLIGKELVLRYAQRQTLGAQTEASDAGTAVRAQASASPGFSVVPHEQRLRIVGIIDSEPESGFGGFRRSRVFVPLALAEKLRAAEVSDLRDILQGPATDPTYASLTVRVRSSAQVEGAEAAIKNMGFATFSLLDTTKNLRLFFAIIDLLLGIFGSLALAVATLGIINTLVMAILERRREIGVLKALGAADGDVKQLFFAEAGLMGLTGGVGGVWLGWFIGRLLTWGTAIYLHRENLPSVNISAVPWWLASGAIVFAIVVSLAAGIYPAARAAKLNPVEALRYE